MKTCKHPVRKACAALLAFLTAAQCAAAAFAAAPENTYTGKYLAAINTNYAIEDGGKSFRTESGEDDPAAAGLPVWERAWRQVEPMTEAEARQADESEDVEAQSALRPYRVGDTKKIPDYAAIAKLTSSGSLLKDYIRIMQCKLEVTCVYVSDCCTIWTPAEDTWSKAKQKELADRVEEMIPKLEELFGTPRIDTDKDGKIALFVCDTMQGTAAFFSPLDIIDKNNRIGNVRMKTAGMNLLYGTACDCLHIDPTCAIDEICTVFVHEYQHYIHASYLYDGKTNKDYLKEDETYINEAFSMASQMILDNSGYYQYFLKCFNLYDPAQHSLMDYVSAADRYTDSIVSYGMSFVFGQYIRTRYAAIVGDWDSDFPGKGIYKRMLQSRDRSNQDNTLGIIADILYPADRYPSLADTDARCRQLIEDFWLAIFCKTSEGEHGFNGEAWAGALRAKTESDIGGEQTIRNGMAKLYCLRDGEEDTVAIGEAEDGLRFVPIEETRTVTFDPNGGFGSAVKKHTTQSGYWITGSELCDPFREGYILAGWAEEADAGEAAFTAGDMIPLAADKTVYAVWRETEPIRLDAANPVETADLQVQFRPDEDGVYWLDTTAASFDGAVYNPAAAMHRDLRSGENGVALSGGTTYMLDLHFRTAPDSADTFTIRKRAEYHTVRYIVDVDAFRDAQTGAYTPWKTQQYDVTYQTPCYEVRGKEPEKWGYSFLGWSAQKGADTPQYDADETITVTEDTDLYAVWQPWERMEDGETYSGYGYLDYNTACSLLFTPEKTASYRFTVDGIDSDLLVYDENENLLFDWFSKSITYTLNAGQTYYIRAIGLGDVTCSVQFASDSTKHSLSLIVGSYLTDSALNVKLTVDGDYTLPDYEPIFFGGKTFLYWGDADTGEKLYAGDTVTVGDHDVVLYAYNELYDGLPDMPNDISGISSYLFGLIRYMIRCFPRYIPVWWRCFFRRVRLFGLKDWG